MGPSRGCRRIYKEPVQDSYPQLSLKTRIMAKLLLLVVFISVASALPDRSGRALSDLRASHHHRSHHDDHHSHHSPDPNKCVDISTYGEVQYKQESFTLHGYVCENVGHGWNQQNENDCERKCETKTEEICQDVESTWCELEGTQTAMRNLSG